jgi:transposase-like protein
MGRRMRVETMPKKKYSDEFKADAVALYETHPGLLTV